MCVFVVCSKKIVREWGDRVSLLAGKKGTSLPLMSTDSHAVTVLPGSNKAAYERFAAQLEENNWVRSRPAPLGPVTVTDLFVGW